jgi:O-antigen/teichoic acid export membrane protein
MVMNMYIFLGISAINLLLNFLLIPHYGAYGAAISTIISLLIGFIIGYVYAKKHCYFVPFNWKGIWPVIAITTVAFGLFNFIVIFENIYYSLGLKLIIIFILISVILKLHFKDFKNLVKQQ